MKNRVLGMWRPETITATVGGKTMEPFGPNPIGLLCFHDSLHFVELMSDPRVPRFASNAREAGTAEEDKAAVIGNLIPFLISTARRSGISAYIDDGANRWPAVHRHDAATLYRLAVEKAPAGSALHATGESGITFQTIAHLIGRTLNIPIVSVSADRAVEHFQNAFFAKAFAVDSPVSSTYTRDLLGWNPVYPTLLEDLATGDYFSPAALSAFNKVAR